MNSQLVAICRRFLAVVVTLILAATPVRAADPWITFEGKEGPGHGKHIVFIGGDEEYRSEEALPQLAKILALRHGFKCTVLFSIDPKDGTINAGERHNIPGLEALKDADLMILFTRMRDLPNDQMKWIVDYVESGRPIIGMRTATHAFDIPRDKPYARYSWNYHSEAKDKEWDGGFGRHVLGETWIAHQGQHGKQSTAGVINPKMAKDPILRGIGRREIWGPTDVYRVRLPMPGDCQPLVLGVVLEGMHSNDRPVPGLQNNPHRPIAWTKTYKAPNGKSARVFTTTMGASQDLENEGLRRLLVNACYWAQGLEDKIPAKSDAGLVGDYQPHHFGTREFIEGRKPADYK